MTQGPAMVSLAVRIGSTRLIDNVTVARRRAEYPLS
jgi:pantothenate synthetase